MENPNSITYLCTHNKILEPFLIFLYSNIIFQSECFREIQHSSILGNIVSPLLADLYGGAGI